MTEHLSSLEDAQPVSPVQTDEPPHNPWEGLRQKNRFFENEEIAAILKRALFYAHAGVPIHFQGTPGRGKTAVALEIAKRLGRPISVMTGNDWLDAEDMVGKQVGQSTRSVVDKYIQKVRRSEATTRYDWENAILADAMLHGHTLVYDEFTRSNAKANGILLSVLEEGVLVASDPLATADYIHAHRDFRIILTSNPHDYAGVNASPDALLDRMVTFQMSRYAPDTESGIVAARTGIPLRLASRIVHMVNDLAQNDTSFSMRACILIAQIAAMRLRSLALSDALLAQIAADVLGGRGIDVTTGQIAKYLARTPKEETSL